MPTWPGTLSGSFRWYIYDEQENASNAKMHSQSLIGNKPTDPCPYRAVAMGNRWNSLNAKQSPQILKTVLEFTHRCSKPGSKNFIRNKRKKIKVWKTAFYLLYIFCWEPMYQTLQEYNKKKNKVPKLLFETWKVYKKHRPRMKVGGMGKFCH